MKNLLRIALLLLSISSYAQRNVYVEENQFKEFRASEVGEKIILNNLNMQNKSTLKTFKTDIYIKGDFIAAKKIALVLIGSTVYVYGKTRINSPNVIRLRKTLIQL